MPATRLWMGKVGFELEPLAEYALARIKQGERVFTDETTLQTPSCHGITGAERHQLPAYVQLKETGIDVARGTVTECREA
ncbi:hypothetical protein [Mesorhizobium sp. M0698]|uniref:IS66 family transposase n=1 Tax=Mesorhizobium sp. M0698 TaxID=2956987 RepID=UPI00333908F6